MRDSAFPLQHPNSNHMGFPNKAWTHKPLNTLAMDPNKGKSFSDAPSFSLSMSLSTPKTFQSGFWASYVPPRTVRNETWVFRVLWWVLLRCVLQSQWEPKGRCSHSRSSGQRSICRNVHKGMGAGECLGFPNLSHTVSNMRHKRNSVRDSTLSGRW